MALSDWPDITSPNPTVIPPVEEKQYHEAWLKKLTINAPSPQEEQTVEIILQNYNKSLQELSPIPQDTYRLEIKNLAGLADQFVRVGQAVGLVLIVVNLLVQRDKTLGEIVVLQRTLNGLTDQTQIGQANTLLATKQATLAYLEGVLNGAS